MPFRNSALKATVFRHNLADSMEAWSTFPPRPGRINSTAPPLNLFVTRCLMPATFLRRRAAENLNSVAINSELRLAAPSSTPARSSLLTTRAADRQSGLHESPLFQLWRSGREILVAKKSLIPPPPRPTAAVGSIAQ